MDVYFFFQTSGTNYKNRLVVCGLKTPQLESIQIYELPL